MDTISTIGVGVVLVFGLGIFYFALREPIDLLLSYIWKFFSWIGEEISGGSGHVEEVINYG